MIFTFLVPDWIPNSGQCHPVKEACFFGIQSDFGLSSVFRDYTIRLCVTICVMMI